MTLKLQFCMGYFQNDRVFWYRGIHANKRTENLAHHMIEKVIGFKSIA